MSEVAFAKAFIEQCQRYPIKRPYDSAVDPKDLELHGPYTLPRMPKAMQKPHSDTSETHGSARTLTVKFKSAKNPPIEHTLPGQSLSNSVLAMKDEVARHLGLGSIDKLRLLYKKKPCSDSKSLKDVIGSEDVNEIEFSVMLIGGMPATQTESPSTPEVVMEDVPVAQGESGHAVLQTEQFWEDLEGFLSQRLRDEELAKSTVGTFRASLRST